MTSEKKNPLAELAHEIASLLPLANKDLDGVDLKSRASHENAKREAQDRLVELKKTFADTLRARQAAVFVDGTNTAVHDFTEIAQDEGALAVRADELYRKLASDIEPVMRRDRLIEPEQFAQLMRALYDVSRTMNVQDFPQPSFVPGKILNTFDDIVAYVRETVRSAAGDQLNAVFLQNRISETALNIRYQKDIVPVIVTGALEQEVSGLAALFENRRIQLKLDNEEEITKETVSKALTALKNKVKPNKEQNK